jgi:methylated-DNA-protein-cysteine methyltransferase-like protein
MIPISNKNKDFFQSVYDVVRLIPPGRATSYGCIATYLGTPRSSRMVGWAMNSSHRFDDIPAHRVVNRNGLLTGKVHFNPPSKMEELLKKEGIVVINDAVANFDSVFWDPATELTL